MSAPLPDMPDVQYAEVNGIRMAYYEAGPKGVGIPIVFSHGFPEIAYSWRHQIRALAEAGRWVIAPDQRGYGLTKGPEAVEAYDIENLTADLIGLIDHCGAKTAIWGGHDWGGFVVWQMALRYPQRTAGVIGLNTPYTPRGSTDPIAVMRARMGEEMYIVHFQKPGEADAILAKNPRNTMDFFLRRPLSAPPTAGAGAEVAQAFSGEGSKGFASERPKDGPSVFPLARMVEAYDPTNDRRPYFLTDDEFEVFVDTFTRTGFTGGINWYRNMTRNWARSEGIAVQVEVPSLMVMAERDAVLPPSSADGMEALIPDLEKVLVTGSGHWTQQEEPEQVNRMMLEWLDRRFPQA